MDEIAIAERKKYELLWGSFPEYRKDSPADCLTIEFIRHFQNQIKPSDTVIDFGCGPGRSAIELLKAGLSVYLVDFCGNCLDPAISLLSQESKLHFIQGCLWDLPVSLQPADWFICFDVLEHLPPQTIPEALKGMSLRMKKGGFLSICLCEDSFGKSIGETLHLSIKPADWWRQNIQKFFQIEHDFCIADQYLIVAVRPI